MQVLGTPNTVPDWLPQSSWQSVLALREIGDYHALPEDLVSSSKRWREWLELERPEDEPLPGTRDCFACLPACIHASLPACLPAVCGVVHTQHSVAKWSQAIQHLAPWCPPTFPHARLPRRRLEAHARV